MSEHILEWLPAYHDGELSASRARQVETHLNGCPSCRAELAALDELSSLLQTDPAPAHTPPERFAAQVNLLLPRRQPIAKTEWLPHWVLGAPLGLIVTWAFLQSALWVATVVLTTNSLFPIFTPLTDWLAPGDLADTFSTLTVLNLALVAIAATLLCAWMAFWWAWKKHQTLEVLFDHLEKEV